LPKHRAMVSSIRSRAKIVPAPFLSALPKICDYCISLILCEVLCIIRVKCLRLDLLYLWKQGFMTIVHNCLRLARAGLKTVLKKFRSFAPHFEL